MVNLFNELSELSHDELQYVLQSINQLNSGWCHTVIKFHMFLMLQ